MKFYFYSGTQFRKYVCCWLLFGIFLVAPLISIAQTAPLPPPPAPSVAAQPASKEPASVTTGPVQNPPLQKFQPLAGIPGVTDSLTLAGLLQNLYRLAIVIGALIAVIKITLAGFSYMSSDSIGNKSSAKDDIASSLLGLVIILATVLILETIFGTVNFNFLQNAETVTLSGRETVVSNPITSYDIKPEYGCKQLEATGKECPSGNVGIFTKSGMGCAPSGSVPLVPGQSEFKYMDESTCWSDETRFAGYRLQTNELKTLDGYMNIKESDLPSGMTMDKYRKEKLEPACKSINPSAVVTMEWSRAKYIVTGDTTYHFTCTSK